MGGVGNEACMRDKIWRMFPKVRHLDINDDVKAGNGGGRRERAGRRKRDWAFPLASSPHPSVELNVTLTSLLPSLLLGRRAHGQAWDFQPVSLRCVFRAVHHVVHLRLPEGKRQAGRGEGARGGQGIGEY